MIQQSENISCFIFSNFHGSHYVKMISPSILDPQSVLFGFMDKKIRLLNSQFVHETSWYYYFSKSSHHENERYFSKILWKGKVFNNDVKSLSHFSLWRIKFGWKSAVKLPSIILVLVLYHRMNEKTTSDTKLML